MVLGDVPAGERCRCRETPAPAAKGRPAAAQPAGARSKFAAWLRK